MIALVTRIGLAAWMLAVVSAPLRAQTTGRILGRVLDAESAQPIGLAEVTIPRLELRTLTSEDGRFVLAGIPAGEHRLRAERIGYGTATIDAVVVRAGRATELVLRLQPAAVEVESLVAEIDRIRLIEPEISATRELVLGSELRELPLDALEEAVELTPGVTDGHFRGGRVGQEVYLIDGLEVKNSLEAASQGVGLEVAPTAVEEIEVITGGFGAEYGSALSGVVRYATRRGNPERWEGRVGLSTDHWAPDDVFRGSAHLSTSVGGPIPVLGAGATVFADLWMQGTLDADPRARGLACLEPGDAGDALAQEIRALAENPASAHLVCPYTGPQLPHQRGDKWIGFLRFDRPLPGDANLTLSVLHNRRQQELYTPEFKYNPAHQLGQRTRGSLATLSLDWARNARGRAFHVTARLAAYQLDRFLGVVDPATFDRADVAGFGLGDFEFLGEDFVRSPIEDQLASGQAVPGYAEPGGDTGSPFGPAAAGIFFTEGTPDLANWTRSAFLGADVVGELLSARGHTFRAGVSGRLFRIESYERALSYLPGSAPNYARFYPRTLVTFAEASLAAADDVTLQFGVRLDGFRSGLGFAEDETSLSTPIVDTDWKWSVSPRLGAAAPVPGTDGRTAFRLNYGLVVQPPDFRFFLDTTIGDSLRTDIRRQGNPDLTFERGSSYEVGLTHLVSDNVSVDLAVFLKELTNLVTGSLTFTGVQPGQFTTGDFGQVRGAELSVQARWPGLRVRAGYALQKATGVSSGALDDPDTLNLPDREEFPLAFDRRHAADVSAFVGRAGGDAESKWSAALTGSVRSGHPLDRAVAGGVGQAPPGASTYLPWTGVLDVRLSRDLGRAPGCGRCTWRVTADARNVLGLENVIALRRDTGELAPDLDVIQDLADEIPLDAEPIPRESMRYSALADLNSDGNLTAGELRTARFAAALDRHDPSLFFGEARQIRIGLEVSF